MLVSWIHNEDRHDFGACMWRLRERWAGNKRRMTLLPVEYTRTCQSQVKTERITRSPTSAA